MTGSKDLALQAVEAAFSKNALDPMLLDVTSLCSYADYILILSGRSMRQVKAIAEAVELGLKERGHNALGREGERDGQWLLLDFADLVVHVFHDPVREYYDIEGLWVDAPRIPIEEPPQAARTVG